MVYLILIFLVFRTSPFAVSSMFWWLLKLKWIISKYFDILITFTCINRWLSWLTSCCDHFNISPHRIFWIFTPNLFSCLLKWKQNSLLKKIICQYSSVWTILHSGEFVLTFQSLIHLNIIINLILFLLRLTHCLIGLNNEKNNACTCRYTRSFNTGPLLASWKWGKMYSNRTKRGKKNLRGVKDEFRVVFKRQMKALHASHRTNKIFE